MLGFSPLASATLADDGVVAEQAFALDAITTGAPVVDSSSITQVHSLSAVAITTAVPVVDNSSLTQIHSLNANQITTGSPSVDSSTLAINVNLTGVGITTGAPSVDTSTISEVSSLTADQITTGAVLIDASSISQIHNLTSDQITCGNPIVDQPALPANLSASDITTSAPTIDSPSISQDHIFREFIGSFIVKVINGKFHLADGTPFGGGFLYGDFIETPTLELHSGISGSPINYNFSVKDSSMSGYEFRFRDKDGNAYTTGVTILHESNDPETLVTLQLDDSPAEEYLEYYCLNHSDVGGKIVIRTVTTSEERSRNTQITTDDPVIDDPDYFIQLTSDQITTGNPSVDQSTIAQDYSLSGEQITTAAPTVDETDYFIQLTADQITTGAVQIDASTATANNVLTGISITTDVPQVDQPTAIAGAPLINPDIDGANDLIITTEVSTVRISIGVNDAIVDTEIFLANVA